MINCFKIGRKSSFFTYISKKIYKKTEYFFSNYKKNQLFLQLKNYFDAP